MKREGGQQESPGMCFMVEDSRAQGGSAPGGFLYFESGSLFPGDLLRDHLRLPEERDLFSRRSPVAQTGAVSGRPTDLKRSGMPKVLGRS